MTITELREKRAKLWNAMEGFLDTHRTDKGVLSAEDDATYSGMEKDLSDLTNEIRRMERRDALAAELAKPVSDPLTGKPQGNKADTRLGRASDAYKEDFGFLLRGKRMVHNVLSEGVDANGGYLVPEEFERQIIDTLKEENVMRRLCKVITTASERKIPVAATHSTAAWTAENAAFTESNPTFAQKTIDAYKLTDVIRVGVTAASATAVTTDEVISLIYALKAPYRKNAKFLMNDATVAALRKLKDANGQYLWQPSVQAGQPDRLLGYELHTSPYAPTMAAGALAVAFGDFQNYWIADRTGRTMQRLNELYSTNGQVGFVASERVDGKIILPEGIQLLKMKAS